MREYTKIWSLPTFLPANRCLSVDAGLPLERTDCSSSHAVQPIMWRFKQASSKHIRRFKVVCSVLLLYRLVKMPLLIGCGELEPNERELKSWKERDKLVSVFL